MANYKSKFTGQEIDNLLDFVDDNKDSIAMQSDLPKKVSDLNNDSSFIDNTVNNLVNYYLKSETYTKAEINTLVNNAASGGFIKVNELPTEDINIKAIYLVPYTGSKAKNLYEEYIYIDGDWEMIGTTKLDLSNYVTITTLNTALADYVLTTDLTSLLNAKQDKIQFSTMPTASEDYLNKILQYTGTTDSDFANGRFYKCVTDGTDYSWEETSSGGSGQGTLDFNELTNRPQKDVTSMSSIVTPVPLPSHNQLGAVGFTPIGTIISVMGTTAPNNYLTCDGQVINISDYPELADYFEEQFGTKNHFGGDGTTTFAVPDLRGEFLRGTGTNSHTDQGNGANVGEHQDGTLEVDIRWGHNRPYTGNPVSGVSAAPYNTDFNKVGDGSYMMPVNSGTTATGSGYNSHHTSRPTNTSVLYCIAVRNIYVDARFDYSTDEKVVGAWIDGKPLYQKTLTGTTSALTDSGNGSIGQCVLSIGANIDMGYITHGFLIASSNILQPINGIINTIEGLRLFANVHPNNATSNPNAVVIFNSHQLWVNRPVYVTIQYTKTTD